MNRYVTTLLLLLLIQAVMTATVFWPQRAAAPQDQRPPLAPRPVDQAREITIGDAFDNRVLLLRTEAGWVLPYLDDLPADPERILSLLQTLDNGAASWPVADSAAARQRFQVAEYLYQRRIDLSWEGHTDSTIFLGTSPGFRKVHARNREQGDIYSIRFNNFDAPATSGSWLDPKLLQVRAPLSIVGDGYSLQRQGDHWVSGNGNPPDERELERLLGALRNLRIEGVADADGQRELSGVEADIVLEVVSLAGPVNLELFALEGGHYIHSSHYPFFFVLGAWDYERLSTVDLGLISGEGE